MKNSIGKILQVLCLLLLAAGLCACGKEKTENVTPQDEYGYLSTYKALKLDENGTDAYIMADFFTEKQYMYLLGSLDENFDQHVDLYSYDLETDVCTHLVLDEGVLGENEFASSIAAMENGDIYIMVTGYLQETGEDFYSIKVVGTDGKLKKEVSIGKFLTMEEGYLENTSFDAEGNIYISTSSSLMKIDSEGNQLCKIPINGYLNSIFSMNGKTYVTGLNYEDFSNYLGEVNVKANKIDKIDIGVSTDNAQMHKGLDNTILISGETYVKSLNLDTKEVNNLWNWYEVDAADATMGRIIQTDEDKYLVFYQNWEDNENNIYVINIRKELLTDENRKTNILFGCVNLNYDVKKAITRYNRSNDVYRILPVEYSETYGWEQAYEKYEQDLTAGKVDILDASDWFVTKYVKLGALADLSKYFERDIYSNADKYNVDFIKAFKENGKDYVVVPSLNITTMVAPAKIMGNKESLSVNDLIQLRKQYPDKTFLNYASKSSAFYYCLMAGIGEYVNWDKGTCDFTKPEFISLLEFANTFPQDIDYANYNEWELMRNGEIVLAQVNLGEMADFQIYKKLMGDDIKIVGYPNAEGKGNVFNATQAYAIASSSKNIDGAWDFLKTLYDSSYQDSIYDIPVLKSSLDKKFEEAMRPEYYTDENGNKVEYPKTSWGNEYGDQIEVYAATKEEVAMVRAAFEKATKVSYFDDKMLEIISEELDSFFKGAKSAKEVADIIQSRVKIYLAEMY